MKKLKAIWRIIRGSPSYACEILKGNQVMYINAETKECHIHGPPEKGFIRFHDLKAGEHLDGGNVAFYSDKPWELVDEKPDWIKQ